MAWASPGIGVASQSHNCYLWTRTVWCICVTNPDLWPWTIYCTCVTNQYLWTRTVWCICVTNRYLWPRTIWCTCVTNRYLWTWTVSCVCVTKCNLWTRTVFIISRLHDHNLWSWTIYCIRVTSHCYLWSQSTPGTARTLQWDGGRTSLITRGSSCLPRLRVPFNLDTEILSCYAMHYSIPKGSVFSCILCTSVVSLYHFMCTNTFGKCYLPCVYNQKA